MRKNNISLLLTILTLNFVYLPSLSATASKVEESARPQADNISGEQKKPIVSRTLQILCPKKVTYDQLMVLDRDYKVVINNVTFTRTPGAIWDNIDFGPYKKFMASNSPITAHYKELDFIKANADVRQRPEKITCLYSYSLPNNDVKGSSNISVVTTRNIGLIYKNPQ